MQVKQIVIKKIQLYKYHTKNQLQCIYKYILCRLLRCRRDIGTAFNFGIYLY